MGTKVATEWNALALRRAQFLLDEARSAQPTYDATVKYALRVISNVTTVGADMSSEAIKWRNKWISRAALELREAIESDKEWHKLTTNEHPEPISQVWEWIKDGAAHLTPDAIVKRFQEYPMITITCIEDSKSNEAGQRFKGHPDDRLKHIEKTPEGPPRRRER